MSSSTTWYRAGIAGLSALVAATVLALTAPANATWPADGSGNNAYIGLVDQVPHDGSAVEGATLIYPGQSNQAVGDIWLVVPNTFQNGDVIDLAIFDRAGGSTLGQANTDAAHKLVWSPGLAPTVTVDPTSFEPPTRIGPDADDPFNPENAGADTTNNHGSVPPMFTTSLVSSTRANGLGADILRLQVTDQAQGHNDDKWIVAVGGLTMDAGTGATPGEVRVVPFAYDRTGTTFGDAKGMFHDPDGAPAFGNTPDDPNTAGDQTKIATYTVPTYVSPLTFTVAEPSSIHADGATTIMGDITISETNTFSLQDGSYRIDFSKNADGSGGTGVAVQNCETGCGSSPVDPITATVTGDQNGEAVTNIMNGANAIVFTLSGFSSPGGANGPNARKSSVVLHNVQLSDTNPESFFYHLTGGSIDDNMDHSFLVRAGFSHEIPIGYGGNGNNLRGVEDDAVFYQGLGGEENQQNIRPPALVFPGQSVALNKRIGGADRYGTAAKLALSQAGCTTATCPAGVGPLDQSIVLASGENFPDALSGNFLASSQGTGILLTRAGSLPQVTEDAICELGVQRVFIVGGTNAVSTAVENHLKSIQQHNQGCNGILGTGHTFLAVTRLAGADRYKTNKAVNEYAAANNLNAESVGTTNITFGVPAKRTALVATGENFPDALAAGPATFFGNFPIVLTPGAALGGDAAAQLSDLGIEQSVIVGGESAVSSAAAGAIPGAVKRIAGADRYETATKLADFEITPAIATSTREGGLGFDDLPCAGRGVTDCQEAFLATGQAFADALAGGPVGGNIGFPSPILLTTPTPLSAPTQAWLAAHKSTYVLVQALGLGQAVSDAALTAANQAVS